MLISSCAKIEALTDTRAVWDEAVSALDAVGVRVALYISTDPDRRDIRTLATAPEIWGDGDPASDPFLEYCCHSYVITHTGAAFMADYPYLPPEAQAFIARAEASGFRAGLGIPMRLQGSARFGGFNLGTAMDRAAFEAEIVPQQEVFRLFCLVVHRKLEELGFEADAPTEFRERLVAPETEVTADLSPREREVLWLQVQGMPRKEVARMCAISPHTVAEYTSNAYRKLGVRNRMEAARLLLAG